MTDYTRITRKGLAQELGASLGEDKAWEQIKEACDTLQFSQWVLSRQDTLRILNLLRQQSGLVGITARAMGLRVAAGPYEDEGPQSLRRTAPPAAKRTSQRPSCPPLSLARLTKMLSESIGLEQAQLLLREASDELGFSSSGELTPRQASLLLDRLKRKPGLIGVSAHFVSTRLHMVTTR